jgi:peptide/nickel transport system substrate-binding protein
LKKIASLAIVIGLLLLSATFFSPRAQAALPTPYNSIINPYTLTEATIGGEVPITMDPACAYDTASDQVIQHVYDTLVMCNGDHLDQFVPSLAVEWTMINVSTSGTQNYALDVSNSGWSEPTSIYNTGAVFVAIADISGDTVMLTLTSTDGNAHVFAIPALGIASPSFTGTITYTFTNPIVSSNMVYTFDDADHPANAGELIVMPHVPWNVRYANDFVLPYWYMYVFKMRPDAPWQVEKYQNPGDVNVTPGDVAYSYQREMILDYAGGPEWMMDEPLLGTAAGVDNFNIGTVSSPGTQAAMVGEMIHDAVEYNDTMESVWLNIAFATRDTPSTYGPMMDILTQTWSSILSKDWINNYVIPLGKANPTDPDFSKVYPVIDWNGSWAADYTQWLAAHFMTMAPTDLDYEGTTAGALMMGSGPFSLFTLDYYANYWTVLRFKNYHGGLAGHQMVNPVTNLEYPQGWPAPFPAVAGTAPAGYVNNFTVTWNYDWSAGYSLFLAGQVDFVAVPRQYIYQLYQSPNPPYNPPNYPLDGIRCIDPLPELEVNGIFFQFSINPASPYGTFYSNGTYGPGGIPYDFFGNAQYGNWTRLAFAYAIDYNTFIAESYLGEASHPATAIVPGLTGYDPSVQGYNFNLTKTAEYFKKTPEYDTGFTITIIFNLGSVWSVNLANMLQTNLQSLNSPPYNMPGKIIVNVVPMPWDSYTSATVSGQLALFMNGWLADYPDIHDFAAPFYSYYAGFYATWQRYEDPTMEKLIYQDMKVSTPSARQAIDSAIQKLAVKDCSFVATDQPTSRLFERDWVVGWYYNPIYPDVYAYNLWKWYYQPQAGAPLANSGAGPGVIQPYADMNPTDTNYDGKVNMKDVAVFTSAFGTSYGPPIPSRWVFRADINNDRKINMADAAYIAGFFGKSSLPWVPPQDS